MISSDLGLALLRGREEEHEGSTAVTRPAEACLRASMVINSSMMPSETGEHEVWITKTSASRTFSSICTSMFSLENRTRVVQHGSVSSHLQMSRASSGCALPPMTLTAPITPRSLRSSR